MSFLGFLTWALGIWLVLIINLTQPGVHLGRRNLRWRITSTKLACGHIYEEFFGWMIVVGGPSPLWVAPALQRSAWAVCKRQRRASGRSKPVSSSSPWFLLNFLQWWTVAWKFKLIQIIFSPKLLLFSMLITVTENKPEQRLSQRSYVTKKPTPAYMMVLKAAFMDTPVKFADRRISSSLGIVCCL